MATATVAGLLLALVALIPTTALGTGLPEHEVLRTTQRIVIDGILDDPDWGNAAPFAPFKFPWLTEGEAEQTQVKMLWDDDFLYVSYLCHDRHIWADHYNTNDHTFADDCVEMFWNPNPEDMRYYNMFEFNAIGNLLSVYNGPDKDISERSCRIMVPHIAQTIRGTVNNDADVDTSWVLEVAVRFSDYTEIHDGSTPEDGVVWRVGLNRCGGKVNEQFSQWSPSQTPNPSFHKPDDFGQIIFRRRPVR